MPIRPENADRYPPDWGRISHDIRAVRAVWRCECRGECGLHSGPVRCNRRHGDRSPDTGAVIVLTTAHRDHVPEHCGTANLFAACQRCHLGYDRAHHAETAWRTRHVGQFAFFDWAGTPVEPGRYAT